MPPGHLEPTLPEALEKSLARKKVLRVSCTLCRVQDNDLVYREVYIGRDDVGVAWCCVRCGGGDRAAGRCGGHQEETEDGGGR